jgi:hexokinase
MLSGMYMGEIVRLIILDLLQQELLFLGHRDSYGDYKTPLYNRGGFYTKFVSTVETDEGNLVFKIQKKIKLLFRY